MRVLQRLRRGRAGFFMLHLAVNNGGESFARVPHDILPHVQHRPARRIHERASLAGQLGHVADGDAKSRKDDDIVRAQEIGAFAAIRQEADAGFAEAIVDVRVVNDFAGQEDVAAGNRRRAW